MILLARTVALLALVSTAACGTEPKFRPNFSGPLAAFADSSVAGSVTTCDSLPPSFETSRSVSWICSGTGDGASVTVSGSTASLVVLVRLEWRLPLVTDAKIDSVVRATFGGRIVEAARCDEGSAVTQYLLRGPEYTHSLLVDPASRTVVETRALDHEGSCRPNAEWSH